MPLNPKIVTAGIEDGELSDMAPTLGAFMLAFFNLPTNRTSMSIDDGEFFRLNPERRHRIRRAFPGEMDIFRGEAKFKERPTLWVWVNLVAHESCVRLPVWRGNAFWESLATDSDVFEVLCKASHRSGTRIAELNGYLSDQRTRKADEAKLQRRKRRVN